MKSFILLSCVLAISGQSCSPPDLAAEKEAIMILHQEQRLAHIEKNVSLLLKDSLSDYMEVSRGFIKKPSYSDSKHRFQSYFDAVDFVKWDDVSPPVFSFSDDATMATTLVDKLVITRSQSEDHCLDTTHYAWAAIYKKTNGKWYLHRMVSTNQ